MEIRQISLSTPTNKISYTKKLSEIFEDLLEILSTNVFANIYKKALATKIRVRGFTYAFSSLSDIVSQRKAAREQSSSLVKPSFISSVKRKIKRPSKKSLGFLLIAFIAIVVLVGGGRIIRGIRFGQGNFEEKVEVKGAIASHDVNREFTFPLIDGSGEEVSEFKYLIENAEIRDEIIIKGQKATAVKGRTFLIITLKLKNEYNQPANINSKNYVRLSVNGNKEEWLAPNIHNDPVEVQAISTMYTRLGFSIGEEDKDLILRAGEIDGEKEEINLNLN
jgi:hypothetical protein